MVPPTTMDNLDLPEEDRHPQQRLRRLLREGDVVALAGDNLEIRFPLPWARKLEAWYNGPGRNIVCNANPRRFNLVGITRMTKDLLLLSYVNAEGQLRSERASGGFIRHLPQVLESEA